MTKPISIQKSKGPRKTPGTIHGAPSARKDSGESTRMLWHAFDRLLGPRRAPWVTSPDYFGNPDAGMVADAREEANQTVIRVKTPGHAIENLEILANEHYLTIRSLPPGSGSEGVASVDTSASHAAEPRPVHLVLPIPDGADRDRIEAKYSNGLLILLVPKEANAKGRTIPVNKR